MGEAKARAWLKDVLMKDAGFDRSEAELMTAVVFADRDRAQRMAQSLATAARATPKLPGGRRWWNSEGRRLKDAILEPHDVDIQGWVAQAVSPAPDEWDPNWPEFQRFVAVEVPPQCDLGDTFIVGDGGGGRGRFRVAERNGQRGASLLSTWDVLDDEWNHVAVEVAGLRHWASSSVADTRTQTPEEIVRKLREADRMVSTGVEPAEIARALEISEATYDRWRADYAGMLSDDVKRAQELKIEVLERQNQLLGFLLERERGEK